MNGVDVVFHPEAMEDFAEAYAWYAAHGPRLARYFATEVDRGVQLLREAPGRWIPKKGRYGRLLLRRFPFTLFYTFDGTEVTILAVAHQKRRPGYWKKRV